MNIAIIAQYNPASQGTTSMVERVEGMESSISTLTTAFLIGGGLTVIIAVGLFIATRFEEEAAKMGFVGVAVMLFTGFIKLLAFVGGRDSNRTEASKPEPPPEPPAPDTPSDPFNWTPILWILAVLAILIVAAILVALLVYLVGRLRRARAHAKQQRRARDQAWSDAFAMWAQVKSDYTTYETDPQRVLSFPLIADVTEPETAAFHRAFDKAHSLARGTMPDNEADIEAFATAVDEARIALRAAIAHATKIGTTHLTTDQRDKLRRAQRALATALDENAPAGERQNALDRVATLIEGIVLMPEAATKPVIAELETIRRKELTR